MPSSAPSSAVAWKRGHDARIAPRYIPRRSIGGVFNKTKFTVMQISSTGLRIRHDETLLPGEEGQTDVMHSTRFVLVDREGRIRGYYDEADGQDTEKLLADIGRLL